MRGSRIKQFGKKITMEFMNQNNLVLIVRAHEAFPQGFQEFFGGRIISLFSCTEYCGPVAGKALYVNTSSQREIISI